MGARKRRKKGAGSFVDTAAHGGSAKYVTAEAAAKDFVSDANVELREYLREWRRSAAKQQGVPAFVVMHDTSLDELCRVQPASLRAVRSISGFGERKVELYGQEILEALKRFRDGDRASGASEKKLKNGESTYRQNMARG